MSSVESPHEASQSGHGGGLRTVSRALSSNHGGRGGAGLRDILAVIDGIFEKAHTTERVKSAPLNT